MEGETSWVSHCTDNFATDIVEFDSFLELNDETDKEVAAVSLDLILPDDLLERILAYLPIASILRAGSVCKRWYEIVTSKRFLWNGSHVASQKPWYFMFTSSNEAVGYAYDPVLRKWHGIDLPGIETSNWFIASSAGLVCFMDNDSRTVLYVCNPITKCCKGLDEPPGPKFSDYSALAVSLNRASHNYNVSIVKSKQVPGNFFQWDLSIHLYDSETMTWVTTLTEILTGWRAGDESVICDGVLYFLIYSTGGGGPDNRHGLIMYNLKNRSSHCLLMRSFIPVPCSLTCGRLMNLKEKLVMVGGIGKQDRPDIIKGIGIWVLKGREWQEIARMPHKLFQGFGEFDDVFASSGTDDLVYIQSYGGPALLVFDINQRQWKWSQKCPVTKRFPLQLFTGFCFEPRKLGANLWEVQPHHKRRMAKMSTKDGHNMIHYEGEKISGLPKQLAEAQSEIFAEQLTSGINLGKQVASLLAGHNQRVGLAQQPASPSSYCSSMEMAPSRTAFTTNSSLCSKAKTGVSSYGLKTSTELLKVLNRIWSLEERHALDMSLVKMLRREVQQSQSRIAELLQEKKRDKEEIDNLTKQVMGAKVFRKNREQERMKDVVKLMGVKLEDEQKFRKHLESLYQKRSQEHLEVEALLSNALKELEHEKKRRTLLEDLCDEFAKGVRDYEQEVRFLKQKSSMDQLEREGHDSLILHISEAWLDERMQMKLADPQNNAEKPSVLDRLSSEIETFLQTKKSCCHEKTDHLSSKKTRKSTLLRHSLESIHLNDPASAPWNANDEDDSVSIGVHCPQFHRVTSLKLGNGFNRQREDEITSDDHPKEMAKFKMTKNKVLPGKVVKGCSVSSLLTQLEECVEEGKHHPMNEEATKSITGYVYETNGPRMQREGDVVQQGKKLQCEDNHSECAFDTSTFTPSPVKKWISEVRMADPHISETGARLHQTLKPNTLKAKLLEARLESQQSRTRASKALFQVD